MKAVLYHFHGIGPYDFSELRPNDLPEIQRLAQERDYHILPTVYLRREKLSDLAQVLAEYDRLQDAGELPNVAGFAIEGPLLGPQGGIPKAGRWYPSTEEWSRIVELGSLGLRYIVMAPDALALDERVDDGPMFAELLTSFYDNEIRIAQGHFYRNDPERSAARMLAVLEFLHSRYESSPYLVLTDHLYNDMPRNFVHAWREPGQQAARAEQLRRLSAVDWRTADLRTLLGPVPATMLRAARDDLLIPCLNFDGFHVDLEICRLTVAYLGADRLIALTDHTESTSMATEPLHQSPHNSLWLRSDGKVAAGSSGYEKQRQNMLGIGLDERAVHQIFVTNPLKAISYRVGARV